MQFCYTDYMTAKLRFLQRVNRLKALRKTWLFGLIFTVVTLAFFTACPNGSTCPYSGGGGAASGGDGFGGGRGSGSQTQTFSINFQVTGMGTASASPNPAAPGTTVTVTATPGSGTDYEFSKLQVINGGAALTGPGSTTSFIMPSANVTIGAYFADSTIFIWSQTGGVYTINGFTSGNFLPNLVIPAVRNGLPVTAIGDNAFSNLSNGGNQLTSVVIPDSVTHIGETAFAGNNLTNVVIPNSVITIDFGAFVNNNLTSLTIGSSVTHIGAAAFSGAFNSGNLNTVTIPGNVTHIGNSAFHSNNLTAVTIDNGVTAIGGGSFANNILTTVTIPNSVTYLGSSAFSNNNLTSVSIGSGIDTIRGHTFYNNNLESITIPANVTTIGSNALGHRVFARNPLTRITIEGTLTSFNSSENFTTTPPNSFSPGVGWNHFFNLCEATQTLQLTTPPGTFERYCWFRPHVILNFKGSNHWIRVP